MASFALQRLGSAAMSALMATNSAAALTNVSDWAQEDVNTAMEAALVPASIANKDAKGSITRAEFCGVALNLYSSISGEPVVLTADIPFLDTTDPYVSTAYELGLINGRGNNLFDPDSPIQRQDLCVVLGNILAIAGVDAIPVAGDAVLEDYPDANEIEDYAQEDMIMMIDYSVVCGVTNPGTATMISPRTTASREQALILATRFCDAFTDYEPPEIIEPEEEEDESATVALPFLLPTTSDDKKILVYGPDAVPYATEEEAAAHMTEISVPVWRLMEDGSKVSGTAYLTVNAAIAPLFQAVFEEIYNGDEQFPIKDAGCFSFRTGEHSQGTAIDINWDENMEATINEDGSLTPTTGTCYAPGENPYSIPEDGDVYNAFIKYGFIWGGNAWRSKRDFMHFSFFGT